MHRGTDSDHSLTLTVAPQARATPKRSSMRHHVEDDVDRQRICHAFGERMEVGGAFSFTFPSVAVVAVVQREYHQPTFVIKNRAVMHLLAIRPALPRGGSGREICDANIDSRHLILFSDREETMIDWMIERQFNEAVPGQHLLHHAREMIPLAIPPEVREQKKSAIEQKLSQAPDFIVVEIHRTRSGRHEKRIVYQIRLVRAYQTAARIDFERCHLLQPE